MRTDGQPRSGRKKLNVWTTWMIGHEIAVDFPVYWAGAYRSGEAEWENLRQLCIGFILGKGKSFIKV